MAVETICPFCDKEFEKSDYRGMHEHYCDEMKAIPVPEIDDHYFACWCSFKGNAECKKILSEAKRLLGAKDQNLITGIVYALNWDYNASITNILNDQWSAVCAETYNSDDKPTDKLYIQCDSIEAGFAAVYLYFYQKYGIGDGEIQEEKNDDSEA